MGLFNRHKNEESKLNLPKLPELPELPNLNSFNPSEEEEPTEIHQLPSFPTNSFGEKFSQDTIKNAVLGEGMKKEMPETNPLETPPISNSINPPLTTPITQEIPLETTLPSPAFKKRVVSAEPIFIRIDRFEESLEIFEDTKEKIKEMEDLLSETRILKKKEEEELSLWETEIQQLKKNIEKVDKDIFSKIE